MGHQYYHTIIQIIADKRKIKYNQAREIFEEPIRKYINNNSRLYDGDIIEKELSSYAFINYDKNRDLNEVIAEYFSRNLDMNDFTKYIKAMIEGVLDDEASD